jgi:hypothetical protein
MGKVRIWPAGIVSDLATHTRTGTGRRRGRRAHVVDQQAAVGLPDHARALGREVAETPGGGAEATNAPARVDHAQRSTALENERVAGVGHLLAILTGQQPRGRTRPHLVQLTVVGGHGGAAVGAKGDRCEARR